MLQLTWSSIPPFLFVIGVVIFIHELGHLLVAKLFNMRVLAFSLGFGKRIWGFTRGETEYKVSIVPLGGYVKLSGEHAGEEATTDPRDFINRPRWQRILVYLAGPVMNLVLSIGLVAGLLMVGIDLEPRNNPPVLGEVVPDSPAAQAGLEPNDRVLRVDGEAVKDFQSLFLKVAGAPEKTLRIDYERDGETRSTTLTPKRDEKHLLGDAGFYPTYPVRVAQVNPGTPAEVAGFRTGDVVNKIAGRTVSTQQDFIAYVRQHPGEELEVEVERGGATAGEATLLKVTPKGEKGTAIVGVLLSPSVYQRLPFRAAVVESVAYNFHTIEQIFTILGRVFTREIEAKSALGGPLAIADMAGTVARAGFKQLLLFLAMISISIGVMNVLPIPVLDGGQMLILLIESVLRRDLSLAAKERLAQAGLVVIVLLMVTVFVFDGQKFWKGLKSR